MQQKAIWERTESRGNGWNEYDNTILQFVFDSNKNKVVAVCRYYSEIVVVDIDQLTTEYIY